MLAYQKTGLAIALTAFGCAAQADVIYSFEDFEGGTVGEATTSFDGTDYVYTANSGNRAGIYSNQVSVVDASNDPTGQHGGARGNADKHFTLRDPLPLASTGATSLEITLSIYFTNITGAYRGAVYYSASGNFDDTTTVQVFDPTGVPYNVEDQWFVDQTFTFGPGDVTGGFTDTAKIRIGKAPGTTGMGTRVYFDDVTINGVGAIPEPSSLALIGLGGLLVARRRR